MSNWTNAEIWFVIAALGVATFTIRFSFLGLVGDRTLPDWVLRHLRYTPVAFLPAMVTPAVLWPDATGGAISAPHLVGAAVVLTIGYWRKAPVLAAVSGIAAFVAVGALAP